MDAAEPDFRRLLELLLDHEVRFVVVGSVGAVLHDAPVSTFDLNIVHERTEENADRLLRALRAADAWFREHPDTRLRPERDDLLLPGHLLLVTDHGPLDALGAVAGGRDYRALLPHAIPVELGDRGAFLVLDLTTLIRLKEETGRAKDLAVLPLLRAVLEERGED